jgi:predicted PhzF superfamily epimerase YddE/YHI9
MNFQFYHVDAFTDKAFSGNQAGICILTEDVSPDLMQRIAAENNIAETAFVKKIGNKYSLKWFTPLVELPLCGHGTIASAHILWEEGFVEDDQIVFETVSGDLFVKRVSGNWIELNFPAFDSEPACLPTELNKLFSHVVAVNYTNDRYLIELETEMEIINFIPDFTKLKDIKLIISSRSSKNSSYDFVSRYFAFPVGVPEDPVTGSAHCSLGPYWSKKLNKNEMIAFQASSRGGIIKVKVFNERVFLAGKAVTIFKGEYKL